MLRSQAHLVPWAVLAAVIGVGIAAAHRESSETRVDALGSPTETSASSGVAVQCTFREGFTLRLAIKAQWIVSALGSRHADQSPGATCRVVP